MKSLGTRVCALLLAIALMFSLVACGSQPTEEENKQQDVAGSEQQEVVVDSQDTEESEDEQKPEAEQIKDTVTLYTVTFKYNYGDKGAYKTVSVESGKAVAVPVNPTRDSIFKRDWFSKRNMQHEI